MSIRYSHLMVLFSPIFLLFLCVLILLITERTILKCSTIIVDLSILPFTSVSLLPVF